MHQSPQKQFAGRREKYADAELTDMQAERQLHRGTQPKAKKFQLREESAKSNREARWDRQLTDW
jgi:hypothetical protein